LLLCGGQVRHGDAACFGAQAERISVFRSALDLTLARR
jgi:hypothetical protein